MFQSFKKQNIGFEYTIVFLFGEFFEGYVKVEHIFLEKPSFICHIFQIFATLDNMLIL